MSAEAEFKRLLLSLPDLPRCSRCHCPVAEPLSAVKSYEISFDGAGETTTKTDDAGVCYACVLKVIMSSSYGRFG